MNSRNMLSYLISFHLLVLCSCNQTAEPETYLIPQGFTGRVNIVFNREDGVSAKYEDGRRVYQIPASGILLTQFKDEYGLVDALYFYVDSIGKRKPLPIYRHDYNPDGSIKWIIKDSTEVGVFLSGTSGQYNNKNNTKSVKWQEFAVFSYKSFQKMEPMDSFRNRVKRHIGFDL